MLRDFTSHLLSFRKKVAAIRLFALFLSMALINNGSRQAFGQAEGNEPRLAELLSPDADSYLAFRSSLKLEKALANSSTGSLYRAPAWQMIARRQESDYVGSFLNPQPWFGFRWEHLSGLDAQGVLFSMKAGITESGTISGLVFANASDAQKFVSAWLTDCGASTQNPSKQNIAGTNIEAVVYMNQAAKCQLVWLDRTVVVSASDEHLRKWLQDSIDRGVWKGNKSIAPNSLSALEDFRSFENSTDGDVRLWIKPADFIESRGKPSSPTASAWRDAMLPSLRVASVTMNVPNGRLPWILEYKLQTTPSLTNAAKLLSLRSDQSITLPPFDLSDAEAWIASSVQVKEWFEGMSQAMNIAIDPKVPGLFDDMIDAVLTDLEGPRLDLKKELFYRCKPSMAMASKSTINESQQSIRDFLWILSLDQGVDASKMAEQLFAGDDVVMNQKVGAFNMWSTRNGEPLLTSVETDSINPMRAMACNADYLLVSTRTDWLKSIIERVPNSNNRFTELNTVWSKRLGTEVSQPNSLLQGVDGRRAFRIDWESVRRVDERSFLASVFIEAVLGGTAYATQNKSMIPDWESVQFAFGIISHRAKKERESLDGVFYLDRADN